MANERDRIRMSDEEVREYLAGRHTMSLATVGPDGRIHVVGMWYGFIDGQIVFETKGKSQKVQNLRRDDRLTGLVITGVGYDEIRGVELVGRGEIVEDEKALWEIGVAVFERYMAPLTPETEPVLQKILDKRVGIRFHVDRVVSWDHSKLT
jgi:PPOX class probable F420-dependent enzyme